MARNSAVARSLASSSADGTIRAISQQDDQLLALRDEPREQFAEVRSLEIFNDALIGLEFRKCSNRPAPEIEVHQISLEARIAAHRGGKVGRHERLADIRCRRDDSERPPSFVRAVARRAWSE